MPGGKAWDASRNEMGPKGYPEPFYSDARKFDSGGKPNLLLLPMLRASLEQVVLLDLAEAKVVLDVLMKPLVEWAQANRYSMSPGPHASHLMGFRPLDRDPRQMIEACQALRETGIFIAVRCGYYRVSPYIDTTNADIQRLIDGLRLIASTVADEGKAGVKEDINSLYSL